MKPYPPDVYRRRIVLGLPTNAAQQDTYDRDSRGLGRPRVTRDQMVRTLRESAVKPCTLYHPVTNPQGVSQAIIDAQARDHGGRVRWMLRLADDIEARRAVPKSTTKPLVNVVRMILARDPGEDG